MYDGAPISQKESLMSIYQFAISNRLTDSGTRCLLDLIRSHCRTPNLIPPTVNKLKKMVYEAECTELQYCSICMGVIEITEPKCTKCRNGQVCFYTVLNFEKNIEEIFTSELTCDYNTF